MQVTAEILEVQVKRLSRANRLLRKPECQSVASQIARHELEDVLNILREWRIGVESEQATLDYFNELQRA